MNVATMQPLDEIDRVSQIENRIRDYILQNQLQPGDKLPTEEQLAAQLQVGRTAVRETFRRLEALGIVESHQGYGRIVRDFNFDPILNGLSYGLVFQGPNILQVLEIRRALDDFFIKEAIEKLEEADIAELEAIVQRMIRGGQGNPHFHQEDHDFHALLYRRCGNQLAAQLFEITWTVRMHAIDRHTALSEMPPGIIEEHSAILAAIKARDIARARQYLLEHHNNTLVSFQTQIAQHTAGVPLGAG